MLASILASSPLLKSALRPSLLRQSVGLSRAGRPPATVVLEAAEHEIADVARLHASTFDQPWSEEELLRLSRRPGASIWLARSEGRGRDKPLGFVILSQAADEAEIISIGVAGRSRRKGVGDALMRAAIREAQTDRAHSMFLEVDEANAAAVALYRRLGFRQVGERQAYYAKPDAGPDAKPSRALVMRLDLR